MSSPEVIDPMILFASDQGYSIRRSRTRRPRLRFRLDYLGLQVRYVRLLRSFLQQQRLGALDFAFFHPTAVDIAQCLPTTPVQIQYQHGLVSGMWVGVSNSPNPSINGGVFQVTLLTDSSLALNGTHAAGIAGPCSVILYLPRARGIFQEDTWQSPATVMGPDQVGNPNLLPPREGLYNVSVLIEEQF